MKKITEKVAGITEEKEEKAVQVVVVVVVEVGMIDGTIKGTLIIIVTEEVVLVE